MRKRYICLLASAVMTLSVLGFTIPVAGSAGAATPDYYLALGDSLSVGWQPNANGIGIETDQGYVDDIFASELNSDPNLQVVKLGCPGETTKSFIQGGVCPTYVPQLMLAKRFLKHYGAQTSFVTIDIGANNVDNCLQGTTINFPCISQGLNKIKKQLPIILSTLEGVDPGVHMYAMNYYDPYLALYLEGQTTLAQESETLAQILNSDEAAIYAQYNVPVVDVADTPFLTYDNTFNNGDTINGNPVPDNVYEICALTYMCAPSPVGPNIHPNPAGYQGIADQFLQTIQPAL